MYHGTMSVLTLSQVRDVAQKAAIAHGANEMYVYDSVARGDNVAIKHDLTKLV